MPGVGDKPQVPSEELGQTSLGRGLREKRPAVWLQMDRSTTYKWCDPRQVTLPFSIAVFLDAKKEISFTYSTNMY